MAILWCLPLYAGNEQTAPLPDPNHTIAAENPASTDPNTPPPSPSESDPNIPATADPLDFGPLDPNDPNSPIVAKDPNDPFYDAHRTLSVPSEPTHAGVVQEPTKYWQPAYHPQITDQVFRVLSYPYYPGGEDYPQPLSLSDQEPTDAPPDQDANGSSPLNLERAQHLIESYAARLFQWRSINESAASLLEVLRTVELTRRDTGIYIANPGLAVDAKRTLGRLGRTNRRFDLTSRQAVRSMLQGQADPSLIYRLDKLLADLATLFERLAEQNDLLSIALGLGKIERTYSSATLHERIDYSHLGLIPTN